MPNARILEEKKKTVADMTNRLKSKSGVFVDYSGITVTEDTQMRVKLREANVQYNVIKNRLMKFAIKNVGFEALDSVLTGTTSLATCDDDPIAPARIIKEYADKMPDYFEIKAGFMDGKILSKDEVIAIASIPPLPILQAQFLGTLLAPITSLAIVLKAAAEKGGAVFTDDDAPAAEDKEAAGEETAVEVAAEEAKPTQEQETPQAQSAETETPAEENPKEDATEDKAEDIPIETPAEDQENKEEE
ncbi:MAG: 50S ribosomal protein L10 [Oscillospiraceae bacterium]|nr:50S ribosomal protein L10 [Oscillospiraceae bacterium]